ncbi:hypothetical protein CY35_02G104300 [Sphagnum magellanicum]|nr:hypothetical protein CY35_02G104300 [Sphagnum magellanicum]
MTSLLSVHRALACRITNASVCSTCSSSRGASTSSLTLESIVVSSPSLSFKFVAGYGNSHSAAPRVPLLRRRKGQEGENIRSGVSKRRGCCVAQLGFTADPRVSIERAASALLKDAATLLVYQEVFRGAPAQAFLKILLALRRGDDGLKLLESYGEFFKLMAMGQHTSWEDYVLDAILAGEGNPFAEASANIGNLKSMWSSHGVPASLQAAAASDLDALQRLSITESTLSGWVTDIVADVRPEWRTAAASNLSCKTVRKIPAAAEENSNSFGFSTITAGDGGMVDKAELQSQEEHLSAETSESSDRSHHSIPSLIEQDREEWRKKIGGLWRWSEAVPMLESYYASHSLGLVGSTQVMQWRGGKLARDLKRFARVQTPCDLTIHASQKQALLENLQKHAFGFPAQHTLLCGPSGAGKSWLLNLVLSNLSRTTKLRIVTLPQTELKNVNALLEELARHWQLRFVLEIDDLSSRSGEETFMALKSALDGTYQEWPENVLLSVTSVRPEQVCSGTEEATELKHLFGVVLHLPKLREEDFILSARELLSYRGRPELDVEDDAKQWLHNCSSCTIRTAAHFVTSII